jgi:Uma2 family endonuclease
MTLQAAEPQTKRWTREEYYRLAEQGWFQGKRVQLIEGEIIEMPPKGHAHARAIIVVNDWLHQVFGCEKTIRIQMPLNVLERSDPEPDAAVVPGSVDQYDDHPQSALLVIEVSDSSLSLDRKKALLYAAAGVQEYWIVDVEHRVVEVYRNPVADGSASRGFKYPPPTIHQADEVLSPLAKPGAKLALSELFVK